MITTRLDCKHLAYLYANDQTYFDKPGCLKGHGSWPLDWTCEFCCDFVKNPVYKEEIGNE
jgi:hypothetical protein